MRYGVVVATRFSFSCRGKENHILRVLKRLILVHALCGILRVSSFSLPSYIVQLKECTMEWYEMETRITISFLGNMRMRTKWDNRHNITKFGGIVSLSYFNIVYIPQKLRVIVDLLFLFLHVGFPSQVVYASAGIAGNIIFWKKKKQ